jgi:hypothetical protein
MRRRLPIVLCLALSICLVAPGVAVAAEDDANRAAGDHFEGSFGFLVGQRSYQDRPFVFESGEGSRDLAEPFGAAPYDRVAVLGLRYDLRLVVSHVRMLVGLDLPFAIFNSRDTQRSYVVDGQSRQVLVQSLRPYELRFGLGVEHGFGPVAPFLDLVGAVHWDATDLSVDGLTATYQTVGFGFAARAGVRVQLRRWFFVTASGELGLVGSGRWSADLSVGFRV